MLAEVPATGGGGARILSAVPSALAALRANKGRSLLTTLGIIIGVAAVIAIVALGEGRQRLGRQPACRARVPTC